MYSSGYLAKSNRSPASLAAAFAITGSGVATLMLAQPLVFKVDDGWTVMRPIPVPVPIPDPVPLKPTRDPRTPSVGSRTNDRPTPTPIDSSVARDEGFTVDPGPIGIDFGSGDSIRIDSDLPPTPPVLVDARVDPRFARDLQPPYPAALMREEVEGTVTVRVRIGTDGRVLALEGVRSDHEGFLAATRAWALRHWRFQPATRDGVPIEAWRTMTVRFTIDR